MPSADLLAVIRQVHAGKMSIPPEVTEQLIDHINDERLSAREVEVLARVAGGNRNQDIAKQLFISEETVKVHLKHIMAKLGAGDRSEALAIAVRRGIMQL